ncbi:MAG: OadG family transporter subunit [Lachnospiraceae bacterium]|nr:OadG family transporter subunit [Lachnospiraceae bacterium]MDD3614943.1 OadG family transporter subunit [Lachnospiraceae bacterium]
MKQTLKRSLGLILTAALVFSLSICPVFASSEEVDSEMSDYLVEGATSYLTQLNDLTDENITELMESDNDFYISVATAWDGSREETGKYVEVTGSDVKVTDGDYVVTLDTKFENHTGDVVMTFDSEYNPLTMAINVDYPLSYQMGQAGINTLIGVAIVFIILIFLSLLISLFKYVNKIGKKKETEPAQTKAPVAAPVAAPVVEEELTDDLELVAVITAAIAASENTSADGFVVRSIKRANKWKRA